jgi:hypothetical protein
VAKANADLARHDPESRRRPQFGLRMRAVRCLGAAGLILGGLASFSCGTSGHAILAIASPSTVTAGVPFTATVTAMYEGHVDTVIDGPIHFTSSDPAAVLPTLYVFTAADAGVHTFTGLLLNTPGNQTMTVSDYDAAPIAGTVNIAVAAAADGMQSEEKTERE